jgi:hypothetical protein
VGPHRPAAVGVRQPAGRSPPSAAYAGAAPRVRAPGTTGAAATAVRVVTRRRLLHSVGGTTWVPSG